MSNKEALERGHVEYLRAFYERVWLDDEHTSCTHKHLGDVRYAVDYVDESHVRFWRGVQSKVVFVKDDWDWIYMAQKTQIKARGGAKGFFEHCCDDFWRSRTMDIADHAIDVMRPASGF